MPSKHVSLTVLFAAAIATGLVARIWLASAHSLWLDEIYTRTLLEQPWAQGLRAALADRHPPLYWFPAKTWFALGTSDFFLKLLGSVYFVVTGVVLFAESRRSHVLSRALLYGCVLLALSPPVVYFGSEFRMYGLLALEATWLLCVLVRPFDGKSWVGASLGLFALGMTHLMGLVFGVSAVAAASIVFSATGTPARVLGRWLAFVATPSLLAYLAYWPILQQNLDRGPTYTSSGVHIIRQFARYFGGPVPTMVAVGVGLAGAILLWRDRKRSAQRLRALAVTVGAAVTFIGANAVLAPIYGGWLLDLNTLTPAFVGAAFGLAIASTALPRALVWTIIGVLAVVCTPVLRSMALDSGSVQAHRVSYRSYVDTAATLESTGAPVFLVTTSYVTERRYLTTYLAGIGKQNSKHFKPGDDGAIEAEIIQMARTHDVVLMDRAWQWHRELQERLSKLGFRVQRPRDGVLFIRRMVGEEQSRDGVPNDGVGSSPRGLGG